MSQFGGFGNSNSGGGAFGGNSNSGGGGGYHKQKQNHGHGGKKVQGTFYNAVICRVIRKSRDSNEQPKVEVLLQKHKALFGFVSHLEHSSNSNNSDSHMKYSLLHSFNTTCGSASSIVPNSVEIPPLIPVKKPTGSSDTYVFLLDQAHNNWICKDPAVKKPFINYANETIQIAGNSYTVTSGHVWVNLIDLGTQCDAQQQNSAQRIIESSAVNVLKKSLPAIFTDISNKAQILSKRYFGSAVKEDTLIYQDCQFQILCTLNHNEKKVKLTFKNISKFMIKMCITSVVYGNANLLSIKSSEMGINAPVDIPSKQEKTNIMEFGIGGFFSYKDLPIMDIKYITPKELYNVRIKIPLFLYRLCNFPLPELSDKDPNTIKNLLGGKWGELPSELTNSILIDSKNPTETSANIIKEFQNQTLPIYSNFDDFFPIYAQLGDKSSLSLLKFEMNENNLPSLKVMSKFSEPALMESIYEIIQVFASSTSGLEKTLLDVPPF